MTNSTTENLRKNIKKYRLAKGYTQENLSELCGLSTDYISEIERGKKLPSFKSFLKISEILDIPAYKFLI